MTLTCATICYVCDQIVPGQAIRNGDAEPAAKIEGHRQRWRHRICPPFNYGKKLPRE